MDKNPVACGALHQFPTEKKAEIACVCVDPRHENQGIGAKLIKYAEEQARALGFDDAVLPVHAGVQLLRAEGRLPARHARRPAAGPPRRYDRSGRKSQVLVKPL